MDMAVGKIKYLGNQNGIALITVIMATALVAILAVSMTFAQHIDIRRTSNLLEGDRAMVLALGLEEWGRQVIKRDSQQGKNKDHHGEDWALGLMPVATENGVISGSIVDLQGKINLNNLGETSSPQTFDQTKILLERLFDFCEVENSEVLVLALADWLDTNDWTRPGGAEDNEYLLHEPAYLAGNRLMTSPSELLLVEGGTPENYACLADHIAALPDVDTDININTAGAVVIAMLGNISIDDATEIVTNRPPDGYANGVSEFIALGLLAGKGISPVGLGVKSDFFMIRGQATFGEAEIGLYSMVDRRANKVKILGRSVGIY